MRTVLSALVVASLFVVGCSGSPTGAGGGSASGGGSAGGGGTSSGGGEGGGSAAGGGSMTEVDSGLPDAGAPDAGAPDAGHVCARQRSCTATWTEAAPYPVKVDHHTALVHESEAGVFLYVIGGVRAELSQPKEDYAAVRRAKIKDDGSLEAWEMQPALPKALSFHAQAYDGKRVYLMGGLTITSGSATPNNTTYVGDFDAQGVLTWRTGPSTPRYGLHPSGAIVGDTLYFLGGQTSAPLAAVHASKIGADGLNGAFTAVASLPFPRSHHMTFAARNRLFVLGGFTLNNEPEATVLRSVHDASGALTGWEPASVMATPPWTAGVVLKDDAVLVFGGGEGGPGAETYVNRVRRAGLYPDDSLGVFTDVVSPLPVARSHVHHVPMWNDVVYSIGGRTMPNLDTIDRVFIGRLASPTN